MNAFTGRVFEVLERYVVSPWSVLKVECGWRGVDPLHLDEKVLESLLPKVRAHVARMTDDDNADELLVDLRRLLRPMTPPDAFAIEFDV
jgi:hypothetical protein